LWSESYSPWYLSSAAAKPMTFTERTRISNSFRSLDINMSGLVPAMGYVPRRSPVTSHPGWHTGSRVKLWKFRGKSSMTPQIDNLREYGITQNAQEGIIWNSRRRVIGWVLLPHKTRIELRSIFTPSGSPKCLFQWILFPRMFRQWDFHFIILFSKIYYPNT